MISNSIDCYEDIVWLEAGVSPDTPLDEINHNHTRPVIGEERAVQVRHSHQEPVGGELWFLFQSPYSLVNGFPEPEIELENAALVRVEILSQTEAPAKPSYWASVQYEASVRCKQVLPLTEITGEFQNCLPHQWDCLPSNPEVQIFETPSFTFVWLIVQEITEWLVLTKAPSPRLIMVCSQLIDEPFSVGNWKWDWSKWPHRPRKFND